jgi:hypothetical protein
MRTPTRHRVASGLIAVLTFAAAACASDDADPNATPPSSAGGNVSCATAGATAPTGCWQERLPMGGGGFPPGSQNTPVWEPGKFPLTLQPLRAFDDDLWMLTQSLAYSSPDGLTWTEHEKTEWTPRIYESTVFFKGRLWMSGGLSYDTRTFLNDIWSSRDGTTWTKAGTAAWPARGGHTLVVFGGRLWLFGGADHVADDRSTDGFLNDVWVSDDGVAWTQVTGAAPWSARDDAGVVVFDDALYMLGGQERPDIWRSADGRQWTQLTPEAAWKSRGDAARVVFEGKLWVFGGWAGESTNALNDVWFSSDGATWERQAEHAPWAPRGPISIVFDDKIWIYSGKHTGADDSWGGDLWQMSVRTS